MGNRGRPELLPQLDALPRAYPSGVHAIYAFMAGPCEALADDAGLLQRLATREEWRCYKPVALPIAPTRGDSGIVMARPDAVSTA